MSETHLTSPSSSLSDSVLKFSNPYFLFGLGFSWYIMPIQYWGVIDNFLLLRLIFGFTDCGYGDILLYIPLPIPNVSLC
ncbi:hypothetical protein Sjap_011139 [Stephania japonica]|uniref:Uncharacterized protein n=1 Tax=Stephania japonica TaxID=461633 RepID=A0AAP0JCX6_9MAGN